jgi:hypothetical protein
MDTTILIIIVVLALVAVGALFVFRRRGRIDISGPFQTSLKIDGENESIDPLSSAPGVRGRKIRSNAGGVSMEDETGRGVDAEEVTAHQDVSLTSTVPSETMGPKAPLDPKA